MREPGSAGAMIPTFCRKYVLSPVAEQTCLAVVGGIGCAVRGGGPA